MPDDKPYVVILNKHDHSKRFALDRNYRLMKDADIDSCMIKDIVQVCSTIAASFTYPDWLEGENHDNYISIWFNYYD